MDAADASPASHFTRPYECPGKTVCPLVRSPEALVSIVLELAKISDSDVFVDLGCGDARLLLHAAGTSGARCVGFDVDERCLTTSRTRVQEAGLCERVEIIEHDIMQLDGHPRWEEASVVFAYLLPQVIHQLEPLLRGAVERGARVLLFCTAAGRGNVIGDMQPAAQACSGLVRMYCNDEVAARLGLRTANAPERSLQDVSCPAKDKLSLPAVCAASSHGLKRSGSCTSLASRETASGESSPSNYSSCSSASNSSRGRHSNSRSTPGSPATTGGFQRLQTASSRVRTSPRRYPQLQHPRCSLPSTAEAVDRTLHVEVDTTATALGATGSLGRHTRRGGSQQLVATRSRGSGIERLASTSRGASWAAQKRRDREEDKAQLPKPGQSASASRAVSNQVALALGLR